MLTTYERALYAFKNYPKGFVGRITLKDTIKVNKIFSKIKVMFVEIDEGIKVKLEQLNAKITEEKIKDNSVLDALLGEFRKEEKEIKDKFEIELNDEEKELVKKVVGDIVWKEETEEKEKPTSYTLTSITEFLEDLDK